MILRIRRMWAIMCFAFPCLRAIKWLLTLTTSRHLFTIPQTIERVLSAHTRAVVWCALLSQWWGCQTICGVWANMSVYTSYNKSVRTRKECIAAEPRDDDYPRSKPLFRPIWSPATRALVNLCSARPLSPAALDTLLLQSSYTLRPDTFIDMPTMLTTCCCIEQWFSTIGAFWVGSRAYAKPWCLERSPWMNQCFIVSSCCNGLVFHWV